MSDADQAGRIGGPALLGCRTLASRDRVKVPPGERTAVVDTVVDCPGCGQPFALEVDTSSEEQSHFVPCPECQIPLEVFVRCRPGEIVSISASAD